MDYPSPGHIPAAFNHKRNKEKALLSLRGILQGIVADQRLKEIEILFLSTWLKTDPEFKKDGDFLDIDDLIKDILADGVITADELEDLTNLINDIIEFGYKSTDTTDYAINQLLGFLHGISVDNDLVDKEIHALHNLIGTNEILKSNWPGTVLSKRLNTILEDHHISEDERAGLLELITGITGQQFSETGCASGLATEFFADKSFTGSIDGEYICLSGTFLSGSRSTHVAIAESLGAKVTKDISKKVKLLVIGSIATRDWMYSSHGRKIEAAIKAKDSGQDISIISEDAWLSYSKPD